MPLVTRNLPTIALLLLTGSEAMILQWALLAMGRAALSVQGFVAAMAILALLNAGLVFAMRRRPRRGPLAWVFSRIVMLGSLGALLTGPLLLAAFALVGVSLSVLDAIADSGPVSSAALVASGGVAVALGFGSILWGFLIGQRRVRVERIDLPMSGLPEELAGLRIAQITDLHIGPQLRARRLARLIERVNELDADLVAITGDIFDFDPSFIDEGCAELAKLRARHGVYAILGNHDVYTGADAVAGGLARHGTVRLLRDEWERIEIRGQPLYLLGIDDPGRAWSGRRMESEALERLAREVPADSPRVLLMHRPSYFEQVVRLGLPVALAGHTHGGQISLPPPAHHHNISRLVTRWTRGLFEERDSVLYVSRGIGVAGPPIRLNCTREISLLRLVPRA